MDSTFLPPPPAHPAPARWASRGLLWLRHAVRGARPAGETTAPRARPLSLEPWRLGTSALGAATLAAAAGAAALWQEHDDAARDNAAAAIAFADTRLDAIEHELARLAAQPGVRGAAGPCTEALTEALVHASLASPLVQRFSWVMPDTGLACGPEGRMAPIEVGVAPGAALTLTSTGQISTRLQALRAGPAGSVMLAELDPRAFEPRAGDAPWNTHPGALTATLLSADGHRLAPLGHLGQPGASAQPLFQAVARSARHGVAVAAEVDRAALVAQAGRRLPAYAAAAALAVALAAAVLWRRTVLRARLSHRIERGLHKRQFEPFVQPIVDLATGRCTGVEVLMRWNHPQRGILAPGEFIDEAERSGLILGMSELVMARAAHRLSPVMKADPRLYVSINMTPSQLRQPGFAQRLADIFHFDTVPREQVLLELTEREFVDPSASCALAGLRADGWRIAIDDFGTGQSSLAWLEELGVDRIKIDRAFVQTIDEHTVKRPVLDAIIALAGQLGVRLIAEGVETRSQWDYLAARGVQAAQGYLMARPMTIDAFGRWLSEQQTADADAGAPRRSVTMAAPGADPQSRSVWERLRTPGGVDVRDRIYRLRSYRQCFVGREAVDWLVRNQRVSRAEAVRLGRRLLALGLISHVVDEHDFEDRELFYRLAVPATGEASAALAASDLRLALRGTAGPALRDHARGLVRHRSCATGRAIVDWIVARYDAPRPTAVQWATLLMRQGALRHVFDDQPFRDDQALYRPA